MSTKEYFKREIPEGYRIFVKQFEVMGVHYKKRDFLNVMKSPKKVKFSVDRELDNPEDPNAIAIWGERTRLIGSVKRKLGYVPAKLAQKIVRSGSLEALVVRPKKLWISDTHFVEIEIDLLGPKELYAAYKSA